MRKTPSPIYVKSDMNDKSGLTPSDYPPPIRVLSHSLWTAA